jgi:hypothetical protein
MRIFRRSFAWCLVSSFFLLPLGLAGTAPQIPAPGNLIALADELLPIVQRLRVMVPKTAIRKGIKSREEITQFIQEGLADERQKNDLVDEKIVLQTLGLIPAEMDYEGFKLKLLAEQVGGFYNPGKKELFIAGWLSPEEQKPALIHELTHALQDQYFNLGRMMKQDNKMHNGDLSLAHQALAEGDATAVMLDYLFEPMGMSIFKLPDILPVMRAQLSLKNDRMAIFDSAPEFFKQTLVFPYLYGVAFIQKARAHNEPWSAVDKIYADLPASTEQILHPEKYFESRDNPKPVQTADPSARLGKNWKTTYRDVLGEFGLYLLLKLHMPEETARTAARGWGGDRVLLARKSGGKDRAVFLQTVWDDQDSAARFFRAMATWIQARDPQARKVADSGREFAVVSGGEYCGVRWEGTEIRLIVGLPESWADKIGSLK